MTAAVFRARLAALGLSVRQFAVRTGVNYATAKGWGTERGGRTQDIPTWVALLLDAWEAHGVPEETEAA